jgi:hypothetical protein
MTKKPRMPIRLYVYCTVALRALAIQCDDRHSCAGQNQLTIRLASRQRTTETTLMLGRFTAKWLDL